MTANRVSKMGPPSKEPVEAVVDPRAAPRQSLLEVTYAKLDAKGVGARGVNDLPSRVVLLCENDSRLESAETSGSFWPAVFAAAGRSRRGTKRPFAYTGATAVYPDSTLVAIESTGGGILPRSARWRRSSVARRRTTATARRAKSAVRGRRASSRLRRMRRARFRGGTPGSWRRWRWSDRYEPLEEARS